MELTIATTFHDDATKSGFCSIQNDDVESEIHGHNGLEYMCNGLLSDYGYSASWRCGWWS